MALLVTLMHLSVTVWMTLTPVAWERAASFPPQARVAEPSVCGWPPKDVSEPLPKGTESAISCSTAAGSELLCQAIEAERRGGYSLSAYLVTTASLPIYPRQRNGRGYD